MTRSSVVVLVLLGILAGVLALLVGPLQALFQKAELGALIGFVFALIALLGVYLVLRLQPYDFAVGERVDAGVYYGEGSIVFRSRDGTEPTYEVDLDKGTTVTFMACELHRMQVSMPVSASDVWPHAKAKTISVPR